VVASVYGKPQLAEPRSPLASLPPDSAPVRPAPPLKLAGRLILQIASLLVLVHYHKTTPSPMCAYRDEKSTAS
jgi:hypothetical protein